MNEKTYTIEVTQSELDVMLGAMLSHKQYVKYSIAMEKEVCDNYGLKHEDIYSKALDNEYDIATSLFERFKRMHETTK